MGTTYYPGPLFIKNVPFCVLLPAPAACGEEELVFIPSFLYLKESKVFTIFSFALPTTVTF